MAICSLVVSIEFADHFCPDWIAHFIARCCFGVTQGGSVFSYLWIYFMFLIGAPLSLLSSFCPTACSWLDSQEKAKEIKAGSEMLALANPLDSSSLSLG